PVTALLAALLASSAGPVLPAAFAAQGDGYELPPGLAGHPRVVMLTPPCFADANAIVEPFGGVVLDTVPTLGFHLIQLPDAITELQYEFILELLASQEFVFLVEKERRAELPESMACGQPLPVVQQCTIGIVDGGKTQSDVLSQAWLAQIGVPAPGALAGGEPRIAAVIDTGVDPHVPWLAGRLLEGWDFLADVPGGYESQDGVDNDRDGYVDEAFGHGTHIASTIGLIDPNALILPLRVMDSDGNGSSYWVAKAVVLATLEGASVINLSLSFTHYSEFLRHAVAFAVHSGVDVYTSAGNTAFPGVLFPATDLQAGPVLPDFFPLPDEVFPIAVVSVGSVGSGDVVSGFSAYGPLVELWAPGEEILAAHPRELFATWSGTSMACAVASGVGSLLRAHDPEDQPKAALLVGTAVPIDAANGDLRAVWGGGRIDVAA
ncbi:MAG TPA: S8 family serine peptidase, partial [Planctomycetota bacterium]|nr:S8 family serine peptidase [Planctomycetota bacterium]